MARKQHFYNWLIQQTGRDCAIGKLARMAKSDPSFPYTNGVKTIDRYLEAKGTSVGILIALREAHAEWKLGE